jgi:hypothetical protein
MILVATSKRPRASKLLRTSAISLSVTRTGLVGLRLRVETPARGPRPRCCGVGDTRTNPAVACVADTNTVPNVSRRPLRDCPLHVTSR